MKHNNSVKYTVDNTSYQSANEPWSLTNRSTKSCIEKIFCLRKAFFIEAYSNSGPGSVSILRF